MRTPVRRRRRDAAVAAVALAGTAVCCWAVASGRVGEAELAVFRVVNGWPDAWRTPLYGFQLLGVLGMPLLVAVPAAVLRRWRLVLALPALVPVKLLVEHGVLKALVQRERPGTTIPGAVLRDVPSAGLSFPSGHAIIAFGVLMLLTPYLSRRWQAVVLALAVFNGVARVYLGGHAPLDVIGGAAAGVTIAALLQLVVGVPVSGGAPTSTATSRPVSRR
ncbi:phosphatase PAP2 family protein [Modestobacter sp. VKM Ac-2978]|uniref:phosphatase PAP2 family protein n=1 Tax=Modestobacter sp. VKM Ac-2978 TaxID=3004132 RepID=UPI0022AA224C|nr:phosphatase PAP2 family protein [Modestobacter sp. VKM Ac-2978]MCZ2849773.1 phosphatase PAP2 family protein [Modestobacter sp. VKM Ac-2978]